MQQELSEIYFYIKGTLKYRRIAMLTALLVCIGGWAYVFTIPDKFESKAKVHIDSSTILRPLMRGMVVDPNVSALIRIIYQLMFTRPNLEKVAELSQLKPIKKGSVISDDLIENLKKNITISGAGTKDIFDISYEGVDPETAKSVVQAVLTVFSEQTQGRALADASDAQQFIEQQIRDYEIRLQKAEKAREDFKRANLDLLSDSGQLGQLSQLKEQLNQANTNLEQAIARKDVLAEQVEEVQDSGEDWGISSITENTGQEDPKVAALNNRKNELLIKYTEHHPEVIAINKLIQSIQKQNEEQIKTSQPDAQEVDVIGPKKLANPYVQALKMGFDNAQAEVAANQALIDSIKGRISEIERGLNERLSLETEMKNLNRDYETISSQYSELLGRREQAHITEQVDDQTSRLKFKIADPPTKPSKPSYPNRPLFYSLILVGSIVVGFALAFLIYFIRPVFMSSRQVRAVTGLPLLGTVSLTSQGISKARNFDWLLMLTIITITASYFGIMLFEMLK